MQRRRLILRLVLVAAALGALAVGWWAYWQAATDQFQASLEGWAGQQRALGRTVEYDAPVFSGFPFAVRAEIAKPRIAMPAQGFGWQGPTIHAEASPLDPLTIDLHAPGEHLLLRVVGDARSELKVLAGALDGTLAFGRTTLQSLTLAGSGLRATDSQGRAITLDAFSIVLEPAETPPATYTDRLLAFAIDAEWLQLPPLDLPLGDRIDAFAVEGRIMGPIPPGAPSAALEIWRHAGGTLEIDEATGRWGPVRFAGDGTFALDESLQPQGAASIAISGYEPAIDALVASGYLTAEQGDIGKTMLAAFAREPSDGGLKEVRLPVTLQNRKLSVGPLEFAKLPVVEWSDR